MEGSKKRIETLLAGGKPDRQPLFELITNDDVIAHFTKKTISKSNAPELVAETINKAIDSTRWFAIPNLETGESVLPDGRRRITERWTLWTDYVRYADTDAYITAKKKLVSKGDLWTQEDQTNLDAWYKEHSTIRSMLTDSYYVWPTPGGPDLMVLYGEVGLEEFSYFYADCQEIIIEQLEFNTLRAILNYQHLPDNHGIGAVFVGDDMAYKTGSMLPPTFMKKEYFPRLKKLVDVIHSKGIKVMFHSDGNLWALMDSLVETGIDLLNPIEVVAGMDVGEIHRRYPNLLMAGGIDASQLLQNGSPSEIKDAVKKAIDDSEGKILVGSSTELPSTGPLENFLAMRDAVLEYHL